MKLIKSSYKIINQEKGLEGIYKAIELAGRVSHKSEGNIKEGSAKTFVDNMIKLGHGAALEFGTVYLFFPISCDKSLYHRAEEYDKNPYSKVRIKFDKDGHSFHDINQGYYITSNYRVLLEHNWLDDLKYICEPTEYHEKRYCVKFICDRAVSMEFLRHRCMSFLQESTRYCNYSNDRFGNELTFIIPSWCENISEDKDINYNWENCNFEEKVFLQKLQNDEEYYFLLLDKWNNKQEDKRFKTGYKRNPWTPQQARQVLPNALKTELVVCGFASDWEKFFKLRDDKLHAHPDAYALAHPLHEEFKERGYIR